MAILSVLSPDSLFANGSNLVDIAIDANAVKKPVSPYLFGRNYVIASHPDQRPGDTDWARLRDAGIHFLRLCGGNNATKYNWQRKITSHPDWYNNVYSADWDFAAASLRDHLPGVQGMWAFPLLGKAASTADFNFDDWHYNQSKWWEGSIQNLAGRGIPDITGGSMAKKEGNADLYLTDLPDDTAVGILDHWFGSQGLGLSREQFQYWGMDNEPEIWSMTHDDVMPVQLPAEQFIQKYCSIARKARERYPAIKLTGPVAANEWQWYHWNNSLVWADNRKYPWLEFFIKRIAEEQHRSGVRLIDVLDLHFYPASQQREEQLQMQRVFFDRTWDYPDANGLLSFQDAPVHPGKKEYIFQRCLEWLEKYIGPKHGVGLGLTESDIHSCDPNIVAVWYASMMGEFMKHGVEIFAPWTWKIGMWETVHLFSRYNHPLYIPCVSSNEVAVSAYPTIGKDQETMTIVLVNRSIHEPQKAVVTIHGFDFNKDTARMLTLRDLPVEETFLSHTDNHLLWEQPAVMDNTITASLLPLSVVSIQIDAQHPAAG